jgi:predicted ATPase with chaperone activity
MPVATQPVRLVALHLPPNGKSKTETLIPPSGLDSALPLSPFQQMLVEPHSIEGTGLPRGFLYDLILKTLYTEGVMEGHEIASALCLHFSGVVEPLMGDLRHDNLVEIKGGNHLNPASYRYDLTEKGTERAGKAWEQNRYVGPCPVTLEYYAKVIKAQSTQRPRVSQNEVARAVQGLVLAPDIVERIGPAVNSFRSLFLYGPPGNGKTSIAKAIGLRLLRGEVMVPHAIFTDGQVIKVYDIETHEALAEPEAERQSQLRLDGRWVRCQAPLVIAGGELTLHDLDLAYNDVSRYYEAPFQLKANGGMLLIDDFGRQQVRPKDLLNRWIVPLEERIDFLTFHTGKKIAVPFKTLIVFSTNLNPEKLVDGAFLRRIRHKLGIDYPTRHQYHQIFLQACQQRGITFDQGTFIHLVKHHYLAADRPFQACHPRDLLDQLTDFATYLGEPVEMTVELMDKAARSYFARLF